MPTLFLKLTKIWQRDTVISSISTTPLGFVDAPARNAFQYLEITLYCQKLELLSYIFVADSMGICSLVFTQLPLKVEPSESETASANAEFYVK